MNATPERYNDTEVLTTYIETKSFTIYSHGPVGTRPFEPFFEQIGTQQTMLAFVKPHHWSAITKDYTNHTHILLLREPEEQHRHATFLHGMSLRDVTRKRDNMFYSTHLRPYLKTVAQSEFDFYINYHDLHKYLLDWQRPEPPVVESSTFFDLGEEIVAYEWIKQNKMILEVPQWRELLMRGQLEEI